MADKLMRNNCLSDEYPEIAAEWNYKKNGDLSPETCAPHSNKKVWWICHECGYEWSAIINDRANGRNCPECAKKQRVKSFRENSVSKGINDFETKCPDLMSEWDFEKNLGIEPCEYTCSSRIAVWWKCSICGNNWQATIKNRANNHSGCPKCRKYQRTSFPEQALFYYIRQIFPDAQNNYTELFENKRELDIYIPQIRTGIEYDGKAWHNNASTIKKDTEKYKSCREHNVRLIRVTEVESETPCELCDDYIFRADLSDDGLNKTISQTLLTINVLPPDVDVVRDRASIMLQYITVIREKSILALYPDIAKEWDYELNNGITPDMVNAMSAVKYYWKCSEGHSYLMAPTNKISGAKKGYGCPVCSGHVVLPGFNDLATKCPEIAAEWDFEKNKSTDPYHVGPGSDIKAWWRCEKGHSYRATVGSRAGVGKTGCPYCAGKKVLAGYNDLKSVLPDVARYWDYEKNADLKPENVTPYSKLKVWWKCDEGHSYDCQIGKKAYYNSCPVCDHRIIISGVNDFATEYPELICEWLYERNSEIDPKLISPASNKKVWWKCSECGTEWETTVASRTRKNTGCTNPICIESKRRKTREERINRDLSDFAHMHPDLLNEWDYEKNQDIDPQKITSGANIKVWWICEKGHSYQSWLTDRTGKHKSGCPYCAGKRKLER